MQANRPLHRIYREAKEEERVQRRRGPEADERRRPREYHRGEGEPPAQAREHHRDRRAPDRRVAVAVTEVLRVALREVGLVTVREGTVRIVIGGDAKVLE